MFGNELDGVMRLYQKQPTIEHLGLTPKERTLIGVALEYYKFSLEEKLSLADDLPEEAMRILSSTHDDVEKLTKKFLEW